MSDRIISCKCCGKSDKFINMSTGYCNGCLRSVELSSLDMYEALKEICDTCYEYELCASCSIAAALYKAKGE